TSLPERLGVLSIDFPAIFEAEAFAIYPAKKCFDNWQRSIEHFTLVSVFHGINGANLPLASSFFERMREIFVSQIHHRSQLRRVRNSAALVDRFAQFFASALCLLVTKLFLRS